MRHFHSYGPVDPRFHFCVERRALVEQCKKQLLGVPDEGGHSFTIWGPRQVGKTWLIRRATAEIKAEHGERFLLGRMSVQTAFVEDNEPLEAFFKYLPTRFSDSFGVKIAAPVDWSDFQSLFSKGRGVFDRPVILMIDEFDSLAPRLIDRLVGVFRDIYLAREDYWLHGLALVGVRAVLGLDSPRGSPFNVQRSLHVGNLTRAEVGEMFDQYRGESGQAVEPEVVDEVFSSTRGQPGLVGWFGELLTEKYNPGDGLPITATTWDSVYRAACFVEPNNTVLNLSKKARGPHRERVMELYGNPNVPFTFDAEWCNFLYVNGIIDEVETVDENGLDVTVCRFSCPFVQLRLYHSLTDHLFDNLRRPLPLDPLDTLADVFEGGVVRAHLLLERYKSFLTRAKAKGQSLFVEEPRRADLGLREAVGHFHLFAWLRDAVGRRCSISPEFPTGNGKVDLFLRCKTCCAVIEVKSFTTAADLPSAREQTARYAASQSLATATMALFVPSDDPEVLTGLSSEDVLDGVRVYTVAIGWV